MIETNIISPAVIRSLDDDLAKNPRAKLLYDINLEISQKEQEIAELKYKLDFNKSFIPVGDIKWRDSIRWCLEIDADNSSYFLKNSVAVYKCIAFKHGIDISSDIKNKIATTLSMLFKERDEVGRISYNNTFYYGVSKFFKEGLTELKNEYINDLKKLKS